MPFREPVIVTYTDTDSVRERLASVLSRDRSRFRVEWTEDWGYVLRTAAVTDAVSVGHT